MGFGASGDAFGKTVLVLVSVYGLSVRGGFIFGFSAFGSVRFWASGLGLGSLFRVVSFVAFWEWSQALNYLTFGNPIP